MFQLVRRFTLRIRAVSCDEMYVEVSELCSASSIDPRSLAELIRKRIFKKTGCVASIGAGLRGEGGGGAV